MKKNIAEIGSCVGMLVMIISLFTFWKSFALIFFGIGLGLFAGGIFRAIDQKQNK